MSGAPAGEAAGPAADPAGSGHTAAGADARFWAALLQAPAAVGSEGVPAVETVEAWRALWRQRRWQHADPFVTAVQAGFAADRAGWAFAGGVQAALQGLLQAQGLRPDPTELLAFCLTEPGGNRPADLRTTATPGPDGGWQVSGQKQWTTLGSACDTCLVMAVVQQGSDPRDGPAGAPATPPLGRPPAPGPLALRLLRVPASAPGLQLQPMPPTRFVPEVPHCRLQLNRVQLPADALLPGEGWSAYGKAFRTWEDTLVTSALLAYLLREARAARWPPALAEQLLAALLALRVVAGQAAADANAAATHVALAGALAWARSLYDAAGAQWAAGPATPAAERWQRDAALLQVAGAARAVRSQRAWQRLSAG